MEVDLGRVALVARRLLHVHAVGKDLAIGFPDQDVDRSLPPARGARQERKESARVEEPERFTGEMRVGRVVVGQVPLDPRSVARDTFDEIRSKLRRQSRRPSEER